jgi:hypothetical protein
MCASCEHAHAWVDRYRLLKQLPAIFHSFGTELTELLPDDCERQRHSLCGNPTPFDRTCQSPSYFLCQLHATFTLGRRRRAAILCHHILKSIESIWYSSYIRSRRIKGQSDTNQIPASACLGAARRSPSPTAHRLPPWSPAPRGWPLCLFPLHFSARARS